MTATTASALFEPLDRFDGKVPLPEILDWLGGLRVSLDDLADVAWFSPRHYVRNLWHAGPAYQALLLCWRNGQRSPIHNHRGSNCGVRILHGVATETVFDRAPNGMVVPRSSRELSEGFLCASADRDIHQISNLQAGDADLVTLHLYSPPLLRMEVYSLDSAEVREIDDPIRDQFLLGDGI
jgi:cysteine dioxygenase